MVETAWSRVYIARSTGGPNESARRRTHASRLARVFDRNGSVLSEVRLDGPNPYDFTAAVLAWGAATAATGELHDTGTLDPVEGLGLDDLRLGAEQAGMLHRSSAPPASSRSRRNTSPDRRPVRSSAGLTALGAFDAGMVVIARYNTGR